MLTCNFIPSPARRASRTITISESLKRKFQPRSHRGGTLHPTHPASSIFSLPHLLARQRDNTPSPRPRGVLAREHIVPLTLSHPDASPGLHPVTNPASKYALPCTRPTRTSDPRRAPSRTPRAEPPIRRAVPTHPLQSSPIASHSCNTHLYPATALFGTSCG